MNANPKPDANNKRSTWLRALIGSLWFIIIFYVVLWVASGIGIVMIADPSSSVGFEDGYSAGQAAADEFFQVYGYLVLVGAAALAGLQVWKGNLPGTGKYKGIKRQGGLLSLSTYRALPVWLRGILAFVITIVAGGLWGFLAALMGAPSSITGVGVAVIAVVVVSWMFGKDS